MRKIFYLFLLAILSGSFVSLPKPVTAQLSVIRPIVFPVAGTVSYGDDFLDGRSGGRVHEGNDLMGKKMMPLIAAVDGTVSFVAYPQRTWGYSVTITDKDGYRYSYLHINNDIPGTDNGRGDGMFAYAPDMEEGNRVVQGQLIGWMGDSGNAETTAPHLHFEIRAPGTNDPLNPYDSLKAASKITAPVENYPVLEGEILPYGNFAGGMNVAQGNLDTDADIELVTGAGPGGGPLVRTFEKNGTAISSFYAYDPSFNGGVDIATGDIDNDGRMEIITAPKSKGGPHVRIFRADGTVVSEFFAYDSTFRGGVNVSAADLDNDGRAEIVTTPGAGGGPHVRVFKSDGTIYREFFAYAGNFKGGVDVAAVAKTSSTNASIVTVPGQTGGPHVKVFDVSGVMTKEFFAYDGTFTVGLRVAAGTIGGINSAPSIAVLPASGAGPHLKTFSLEGIEQTSAFAAFEEWWRGGYDLAAGSGAIVIGSGSGRRASLRQYSPQGNDNQGGNWLNRNKD